MGRLDQQDFWKRNGITHIYVITDDGYIETLPTRSCYPPDRRGHVMVSEGQYSYKIYADWFATKAEAEQFKAAKRPSQRKTRA